MINKKSYFQLFANCVPVKGYLFSLIYDLQRFELIKIPNDFLEILLLVDDLGIEEIKKHYNNDEDEGIEAILNYFVDSEIGFYTNQPNLFPKLNTNWYFPGEISNAVLEIKNKGHYNILDVISQLELLNCKAIQFRQINEFNEEILNKISERLKFSSIEYVEIYLNEDNTNEFYSKLENKQIDNKHIAKFKVFNSKKKIKSDFFQYSEKYLGSDNLNEKFSVDNFAINIKSFTESLSFNLGLNKKIAIDHKGNIKNHISHKKAYGNILNISLRETLEKSNIKKNWKINNDKIEFCKDCPYRYCCTSNSELIEKNNKTYKQKYCNFNPYEDESF